MLRKWLIQCVAAADNAAHTPNEHARPQFGYVLILSGPQGVRKTSWLRHLVTGLTDEKYFKDGIIYMHKDKDSRLEVLKSWITELGEMESTFSRTAITELKNFLTKTSDDIRKPYARSSIIYPRTTSFCGSVNSETFLRDLTGNRRFFTVAVKDLSLINKERIQKLWAYVTTQYLAGEIWWVEDADAAQFARVVKYSEEQPLIIEYFIDVFGDDTLRDEYKPDAKTKLYQIKDVMMHMSQQLDIPYYLLNSHRKTLISYMKSLDNGSFVTNQKTRNKYFRLPIEKMSMKFV